MGNEILRALAGWGAAPERGIARLLGDTALYEQLLREAASETQVELIRHLVDAGEYAQAFRLAHSLKGSVASLDLTPLAEAISALTELLRPCYEQRERNRAYSKEQEAEEGSLSESDRIFREMAETCMRTVECRWNQFVRILDGTGRF